MSGEAAAPISPAAPRVLSRGWLRVVRLRVWLADHFSPSEWQITLFWAACIGVAGGLASLGFRWSVAEVHHFLTGSTEEVVESFGDLPPWRRLCTPIIGVIIAGIILIVGRRIAKGRSTTDYMEAIALGDGRISFRTSMTKSLAALFAIATGSSIGQEGPMVQLSSMLASLTGRWRKVPVPSLRLLVACGAAAGIASAYNAPIGGAFFIAEIVLGTIAMETLGPLVVSAVAATLVVRTLGAARALYEMPSFTFNSAWEMGPYVVVGMVAGTLAPLFFVTLRNAEKGFHKLHLPLILQLALGGAIVGTLAMQFPDVCGNGYSVIVSILHGHILWPTLVLLVLCKGLATAASFGSGVPGGVFTPTLFMGASLGFLLGTGIHEIWPSGAADPKAFALVGMGAFLAAASHAPVMAIILLFEMTLSYDIILPLMAACTVSYFTAKSQMGESLYAEFLRRKAVHEPERRMPEVSLAQLIRPNPPTLSPFATFAEICSTFITTRINNIYVVDAEQRFLGVVSLHDIKPYLGQTEIATGLLACDILREEFPYLGPGAALSDALAVFTRSEIERIPVVSSDGSRRLLGSLSKNDLLFALTDVKHEKQTAAKAEAAAIEDKAPAA